MHAYENPPELWRHYVKIIREADPSMMGYLAQALRDTAERIAQQAQGRVPYGALVPPESWAVVRRDVPAPLVNEQEQR